MPVLNEDVVLKCIETAHGEKESVSAKQSKHTSITTASTHAPGCFAKSDRVGFDAISEKYQHIDDHGEQKREPVQHFVVCVHDPRERHK